MRDLITTLLGRTPGRKPVCKADAGNDNQEVQGVKPKE